MKYSMTLTITTISYLLYYQLTKLSDKRNIVNTFDIFFAHSGPNFVQENPPN